MEAVKYPMNDRGEHDACHYEYCQSAVEGIHACEQLAGECLRLFDRTHSPEEHRGVEEGIDPREPLKGVVTEHAYEKGDRYEAYSEKRARRKPAEEGAARKEGLGTMLEHARTIVSLCLGSA